MHCINSNNAHVHAATVCLHESSITSECSVPDGLRASFTDSDAFQPLRIAPLTAPSGSFTRNVKLIPSDLDWLGHVNQGVYLRNCQDTLHLAVKEGALKIAGVKDVFDQQVEQFEVMYQAEMHEGDVCRIHVWQDVTHPYKVHFSIGNNDGGLAAYASITFPSL